MPPPDEPHAETPHSVTTVNVAPADFAGNGFLGLTGWMKSLAQFSAVVIVFGLGTAVVIWALQTGRSDRAEDRQLFRDEVRDMRQEFRAAIDVIQRRADERAGEIKGSMDVSTTATRQLIEEIKTARRTGMLRNDGPLPKAIPP
jgi:uncharacterized protein HemX